MTSHPFGTGWRFGPASAGGDRPDFDDAGFAEVTLPHSVVPVSWRDWDPSAWPAVHAEKLGQLADEFDRVHSIERAREVGSVQAIVPAARLRPYLIDAVRRGMQRTLEGRRERE